MACSGLQTASGGNHTWYHTKTQKQKAHLHKTWLSADPVIKETSSPKAVLRRLPEEHFCFHKCFHKPLAALMGHTHIVLFFCLKDGTWGDRKADKILQL